jgi:hypothetical protein
MDAAGSPRPTVYDARTAERDSNQVRVCRRPICGELKGAERCRRRKKMRGATDGRSL